MNIELKFITFDKLMSELAIDLRILEEEGLIEVAQLIKVAQRVNYDLGLRIHQTKEIVLDVNNNIAKLPEDFYVLNFALLTGNHKTITPVEWAGRVTEQTNIDCSGDTCCLLPLTYDTNKLNPQGNYCNNNCSTGNPPNTCTPEWDPWFQRKCFSMCGSDGCVKVIEQKRNVINEYSWFEKLYIKPSTYLDPGSLNPKFIDCHTAEIKNGYLYCSAKCAKVFISYQGSLEDEQGNLLVLDHPEILFYYLSALTEYIYRIIYFSNGDDVKGRYEELKQETREARVRALSIVNMPNFQEMQNVFRGNRDAQYKKYYKTFQSNVFQRWFPNLYF